MKYRIFTIFFLWVLTGSTLLPAQRTPHSHGWNTEKTNVEDYPMIHKYTDGSYSHPIEVGNDFELRFILASPLFPS